MGLINMQLKKEHLGCLVKLSNGTTGRIAIFDSSHMPAFVKHISPETEIIGTWHYENGKCFAYGNEYDIVKVFPPDSKIDDYVEECNHDWQHYHGLFQVYEFCKKCDKKREL